MTTLKETGSTGSEAVQKEATELWLKSYEGEVFGEAYFARVAELEPEPEKREKLRAVSTLERCTKELLRPSLERLGIPTDVNQAVMEGVAQISEFDYDEMLGAVPPLASEYLGYYSRLRGLVGPEDYWTVDRLIAHELALELFCRRERSGEIETSLGPIRALSHVSL